MIVLLFAAAFLAPLALFGAGNAGPTTVAPTTTTAPSGRATLSIKSAQPLTVVGRGFKARESVRLTAGGARRRVTATTAGRFSATFRGVGRCGAGTIVAAGSQGSRASLNVSSLLCLD